MPEHRAQIACRSFSISTVVATTFKSTDGSVWDKWSANAMSLFIHAKAPRGITRSDGARGKKQVWRFHVRWRMLFSELYKLIVNNVTFVGFRGAIAPIASPWSAWMRVFDLKRGFKNLIALNLPSSRVHEIVTAKLKTFFTISKAVSELQRGPHVVL